MLSVFDNEAAARLQAQLNYEKRKPDDFAYRGRNGWCYGQSKFDGKWYVGIPLELAEVGVWAARFSISAVQKRTGKMDDNLSHFPDRQSATWAAKSANRAKTSRTHECHIVVSHEDEQGGNK